MPKLRASALPGVQLIFFSNDHGPPHFHAVKHGAVKHGAVKHGDWHHRVRFLLPGTRILEKKSGPRSIPRNMRRELITRVVAHRVALLREWETSRSDG